MLHVLVCPVCKGQLESDDNMQHLICVPCALAFPVRDGIPVMLVEEAERRQYVGAGVKAK